MRRVVVSSKENSRMNLDSQYRMMWILWSAFISTIALYSLLSVLLPGHEGTENRLLTILFSATSALLVVVSFAVKKSFLSRSVEAQQVRLVNTGFILAAAFCETAALLGLLDLLIARDRYYFVLIALAFVGLLLHFPRRSYLESASYRQPEPTGLS
jgi:F0F1-type ATP synthase membrane subunit c/vacuolar-type H+-ATPase subunit K